MAVTFARYLSVVGCIVIDGLRMGLCNVAGIVVDSFGIIL